MTLFGGVPRDLPIGQAVRLHGSGITGIVGSCLGQGGQGAVYACDVGGRQLALKWYWPEAVEADPTLATRIARLVAEGAPNHRFAWPIDMGEIAGAPTFGYTLPLISRDRAPLARLFQPPPDSLAMTLPARAMACFAVADSFLALHARGLCYQDINLGAFFVDPLRGDVVICDADNVAPDGEPGGVYGTPRFEPPEVVLRAAMPSGRTDLFAMAVLFFLVLVGCHPLVGRRLGPPGSRTDDDERHAFGVDPLFVFDPDDAANRPAGEAEPWLTARWQSLTAATRTLFIRSFTAGLLHPERRVLETEWRVALAGLRDAVLDCPGCGFEVPLDADAGDVAPACPRCVAPIARPTRLACRHAVIGLRPADALYRHHVDDAATPSFVSPIGVVTAHPADPSLTGLHNESGASWTARSAGGAAFAVETGRTVRLASELFIDFGSGTGRVTAADSLSPNST